MCTNLNLCVNMYKCMHTCIIRDTYAGRGAGGGASPSVLFQGDKKFSSYRTLSRMACTFAGLFRIIIRKDIFLFMSNSIFPIL